MTEINRFAVQCFENHDLTSYPSDLVPVAIDGMKLFIGLVMLMGVIYKPSINLYWTTDALYHTPIFSQVMNRNGFNLILDFLHFNNNENPIFDQNDGNSTVVVYISFVLLYIFFVIVQNCFICLGRIQVLMSHWSYARDTYNLNSTSRPSVPDLASNFMSSVLSTG